MLLLRRIHRVSSWKHITFYIYKRTQFVITVFINWMVRALNADWLTAVGYQTICHGYDKTIFYSCNFVGNQFIIEIRHHGGVVVYGQYTTA